MYMCVCACVCLSVSFQMFLLQDVQVKVFIPWYQPFLQGPPASLIEEWCLESRICILGLHVSTGGSFLADTLRRQI